MARSRFTAKQIILTLREAEVSLAQGETVGQVCKQIRATEQTKYRDGSGLALPEYQSIRLGCLFRLSVL